MAGKITFEKASSFQDLPLLVAYHEGLLAQEGAPERMVSWNLIGAGDLVKTETMEREQGAEAR